MASLSQIDHFVVLMLENRSFDNLFGWLHRGDPNFAGLTGEESNPDPQGQPVKVWSDVEAPASAWMPTPDPGELFTDINEQLFDGNAPTGTPSMHGFVHNYAKQAGSSPRDIMHCFQPEQVPVLSALARGFAVCDRWFAAAPCQTWPNRFFVHTATAGGHENNSPVHFPYMMPTIFNALDDKTPDGWKIYFHDFPQSLTLARLWDHLDHFCRFDTFLDDAKAGKLPSYAFIEPRYFADIDWPNDMHPPHNIGYGEQLVAQIYNALRQSPNWSSTMLIITFDEHGGCYDHVPPPAAPMPEQPASGQTFAFDRFGVRVPAVVVSPYIKAGTIFRAKGAQPFDHTAIIKTLRLRFGIAAPLTQRDADAPDLSSALTLDAPSNQGPNVTPLPPPASDDQAALDQARLAPLNDFQTALRDAASHLAPLADAESAAAYIQSLLGGLQPASSTADSPQAALPAILAAIRKLLP
ncbi:alkaline phosphatase family protein [Paludibacterium purpuratum]|uniref:Phospholipase C n=1 Tax=Paludibacterium purpuratum TaxID=1144873 RepID=A0A4V3DVQ9_9NEIS|nr:alkaline phosphatase family protein [Paludibacterium purpuratum]TDR81939.1 phospholipase C [Paludibacterium purpuratum]